MCTHKGHRSIPRFVLYSISVCRLAPRNVRGIGQQLIHVKLIRCIVDILQRRLAQTHRSQTIAVMVAEKMAVLERAGAQIPKIRIFQNCNNVRLPCGASHAEHKASALCGVNSVTRNTLLFDSRHPISLPFRRFHFM